MFFDDKRKINLSGNKNKGKKEDKDQFVQRTRQEREERKQDKEKQKAATRIIKFFRYAHQIRLAQQRERNIFDEEVVFAGSTPITRNGLVPLLRQFLFFYRDSIDSDRFITLSQRLVDNVSKEQDIKLNYCGIVVEEKEIFDYQMKRLLRICLRKLSQDQATYQGKLQAAKVLVVFTYFSHWAFTKNLPAEVVGLLSSSCDKLLRYLVDNEKLYFHLNRHFNSFISSVVNNKPTIPKDLWNAHFVSAVTMVTFLSRFLFSSLLFSLPFLFSLSFFFLYIEINLGNSTDSSHERQGLLHRIIFVAHAHNPFFHFQASFNNNPNSTIHQHCPTINNHNLQ